MPTPLARLLMNAAPRDPDRAGVRAQALRRKRSLWQQLRE
jgi:hypothetical protein